MPGVKMTSKNIHGVEQYFDYDIFCELGDLGLDLPHKDYSLERLDCIQLLMEKPVIACLFFIWIVFFYYIIQN